MDAKPQRIRVLGDENVPPTSLPVDKPIHQRNKSTSALNGRAENGISNGVSRNAFVDLSNAKKLLLTDRDDALSDQGPVKVPVKPGSTTSEKPASEGAILAQPAQRPVSISGIKGLLNNVTAKPTNPAGKAPATNGTTDQLKRNNQVFKDDLQPVVESKEPSKEIAKSVASVPSTQQSAIFSGPLKLGKPIKPAHGVFEAVINEELENRMQSMQKYFETLFPEDADEFPVYSTTDSAPAEDFWEEETAHGDNITGGATTVLLPTVTAETKRQMLQAKSIVEASLTQEDIDEDFWDTSMVAEYGVEIFHHLRRLETELVPVADYMANQPDMQWSMRSVLMDWLVQVHHRFALLPETLFLCVNFIDRFLSHKIVSLGKLQLVGATALFIASKYEEITAPSVQEIVYMVDGGYTIDEILKAERFMLSILDFDLGWPGPMSFLRRISKADDYDLETRTVAKYFMEVTIMDERFVSTPPSFVAAGAHCLALLMLRKGCWTAAHAYYSGYLYRQLVTLMLTMLDCCESPRRHHGAVFEKYSDRRFKRASLYVEAEMVRGFHLPPIPDLKNALRLSGYANY